MVSNVKTLDPVQGLVDYINDIKPYHTKVIESLVEYVGNDFIDVTVLESFMMDIHLDYSHETQYKQTYVAAGNETRNLIGITTTLPTYTNIKYSTGSPIERIYDFFGTFVYVNGVLQSEGIDGSPALADYYFVGSNKIMFTYNLNAGDVVEIYTNTQTNNIPTSCDGSGYGSLTFDDPDVFPIVSPDTSETLNTFPSLTNNSFIVNGDQRKYFNSAANIPFKMASFIHDRIVNVVSTVASPAPDGEFQILGDRVADFSINTIFVVTGSIDNDNAYKVTQNATYDGTVTTIVVAGQSVTSSSVSGFIKTIDSANNGNFDVVSSMYTESTQYIPGYTTVFITGLVLTPANTAVSVNQRYISLVSIGSIEYKKILSYSNALRYYNATESEILQTPNEGIVYAPIIGLSQGSPSYFILEGNFENSNIVVGDEFSIVNSTDNNTSYTINSIAYDFEASVGANATRLGVDLIHNSSADGFAKLTIPSNSFVVDGDYTGFFVQGSKIKVITGSKVGIYTVLYSRFANNETQIRVLEDLIDHTRGALISGTTTAPNGFEVVGNLTAEFKQGRQINVVLSLRNDGTFTISSDATYDINTNTTTILIDEPFASSDVTGEIHKFTKGLLTFVAPGYGESANICEAMPETLVFVSIADKLYIDNYGIWTRDDIIAYGNSVEDWGFELPALTIFNATEPTITINTAPPVSPVQDTLWFDTTPNSDIISGPGILKQYVTDGSPANTWVEVKGNKAFWIDTDTNYMYYRLIYQYYDPINLFYPTPTIINNMDTSWVRELTQIPGFNQALPAIDARTQINTEGLFVVNDSNGFVETTYSLLHNTIPWSGSPLVPDYNLIEVYVNSALANITISDTTTFEIISPILRVDDYIEVRLYDNSTPTSNTFIGAFDTNAAIEETFDLTKGYKFDVIAVDGTNDRIYIVDDAGGTLIDFFQLNALGSPIIDNKIELINTGSPNFGGVYTITAANTYAGSNYNAVLLSVLESIPNTVGIPDVVPMVPIAQALYQSWFQYVIVNTTANTIILNGDATGDINNGDTIKILHSGSSPTNDGNYTVNAITTFDGVHTTVQVLETLPNVGATGWVESI